MFFPWDLVLNADALASAPEGIKPEWYFMFMFQTLKFIPPHILIFEGEMVGVLAFGLAGFIWMIIPFLKLGKTRQTQNKIMRWIGIFAIAYIIILTLLGYLE